LKFVRFARDSNLREIGNEAFCGTNFAIELPRKCEINSGFSLLGLLSVSISPENEVLAMESSLFFTKDRKSLIRYFGDQNEKSIPDSVEFIKTGCFTESTIENVTFSNFSRLKAIEKLSFSRSQLRIIRIPSSVEVIGTQCFSGCEDVGANKDLLCREILRINV
jgi:hypothetical protein